MYSGETIVQQLDQLQRKLDYNDLTPQRALFGYYSAVSNVHAAIIDFYSADSAIPMRTQPVGHASRASKTLTGFATEARAHYTWTTNANNYQTGSYTLNPSQGYTGICCHTQLGTTTNIDLSENSTWFFNFSQYASVYARSGVILGEPGYRQGLNLTKLGPNIGVGYLNSGLAITTGNSSFNWTTITGLRRLPAAGNGTGSGDIGYNRVTNTLAFIEQGSTTYSYRLHVFKNLPKLKVDILQVQAALNAAGASAATYETFDFTWSGVDNSEWHNGTRVVPCDDGSFWLARMNTNSGLSLGIVTVPNSSGTRTFGNQGILSNGGNTTYGRESSESYGIRHMNSDNGEIVAVYCPYSAYLSGANIYFLSRRGINWTRADYTFPSTNQGCSIAPAGGSNFVFDANGNNDGRTTRGHLFNLNPLVQFGTTGTISVVDNYLNISGYNGSTSQGPNGVIKVQPTVQSTTEYKERDL